MMRIECCRNGKSSGGVTESLDLPAGDELQLSGVTLHEYGRKQIWLMYVYLRNQTQAIRRTAGMVKLRPYFGSATTGSFRRYNQATRLRRIGWPVPKATPSM